MTNTLLVPIHLDGLYLPANTNVLEEMTDYKNLPYSTRSQLVKNSDKAYISGSVLSPPFENLNLTLRAGIHLHWAMPDALTNGIAKADGITFPLVPNRWLIVRRGGNKPEKQWVVESDYLYPDGVEELTTEPINILYHPDRSKSEYQPFRFLGRKWELTQWRSAPANALYVEELTAIGPFAKVENLDNEKAAFAGFYPNCRSVFGFHDPDFKDATPPTGLQYDVIGWYSNREKDCLARFVREHSANGDRTLLEALQETMGWTAELGSQNFPDRVICYSQLTFKSSGSLSDPATTLPNPTIAVGNSQEEAIAAYLARQLEAGIENRKIIEQQLEALQLSNHLQSQKQDFPAKFREVLHESSFTASPTENLWRVVPSGNESFAANAAQGEAEMQVTLPTSIGDQLNTTNNLQHEYDQKLAKIGSIREQVYADWYKYMMALYMRETGYNNFYKYVRSANFSDQTTLPDPEVIRAFIRTGRNEEDKGFNECGLPALQQEVRAAGTLSLTADNNGELVKVEAIDSEANSIATRLAQSIHKLIADIDQFNKESRFLVAPNSSPIALEGTCALVEEPVADKCLRFDGNQNYLKVSGLNNVRAISMWVKIPNQQQGYLLDARNNLANSGFAANGIDGNWEKMYVNGKIENSLNWAKIPKNQWIFLYLQANSSFSGAIHLMSNHNRAEKLPGDIASVGFHQQPLSPEEIHQSYGEKVGLLRPSYVLKVVPGPRYWQPNEPVILMTGDAVTPIHRRGEDGSLREDGLLECHLLTETIDLQKLQNNSLEILKKKLEDIAKLPGEKIGIHQWTNQPWNPFLLEWSVQFFSLKHSRQNNSSDYDANTLKENYELRVNADELSPKSTDGSNYFGGTANLYSGASFLSPSASTLLKENLTAYLNKHLLAKYYEAQKTPQEQQTENFLSEHFNQVKGWYKPEEPSVNDPIYTALRTYEQLQSLKCLAQGLGGFNDGLLTYQRTMQLGIEDTLLDLPTSDNDLFAGPWNFVRDVREEVTRSNVPGSLLRSPYLLNDFNPLRAGAMKISGLRIVDTFGRVKVVVDIKKPQSTEVVTSQPVTPPPNCPHPIYLPPRLAQPARLNFRWLSASQGQQEMNDAPTTTPICGWILPNNLDSSLTVYDSQGSPLGIINRTATWQAIPGSKGAIAIASIANRYLRQQVQYLLNQGQDFFRDFLTTLNKALETIDPESFAQNQAISLLVARPLALVRSQVNLQLQGLPAISQNAADMRADVLNNRYRTTHAFEKVKFPIRIGEYQQLNDCLAGYWVETAEGTYQDSTFYAPQSCFVPHPQVKTLFDNASDRTPDTPVNLEQTLEANTAQTLVMLVDPRGKVHASCGILPAKTISIPPEQYLPALGAIEVTFLSAPLLSDINQINLSLPEVPGYVWSWLGKEGDNWSTATLNQFNSQPTLSSQQKIYEGWLKLTRNRSTP